MGVGELREKIKVLQDVRCTVSQGGEDEDSLLVFECVFCGLDGIEVDVLYRTRIDLDRGVVIEYDGCMKMCVPPRVLVRCHFHWRFCGAPTDKPTRVSHQDPRVAL
jgi:hypothetical protein